MHYSAAMRSKSGLDRQSLVRIGGGESRAGDFYHFLLTTAWWKFGLLMFGAFGVGNAFFALLYYALGSGIENAQTFSDAFFFSVQTMATIGYGKMVPQGLAANIIVTVEAFVGLLGAALSTGISFAKLSRPTARVMFSKVAVVCDHQGVPTLQFRMANERRNQILEARIRLVLVRYEKTAEGEPLRRLHDLQLLRDTSPFFAATWTAFHPLTPASPLHRCLAAKTLDEGDVIVVTFLGLDDTFEQTVHARHDYQCEDVLWATRLVDIMGKNEKGERTLDLRRFHDTSDAPLTEV